MLLITEVACDRGPAVAVTDGNDFPVSLNEYSANEGFAVAERRAYKAAVTKRHVQLSVGSKAR